MYWLAIVSFSSASDCEIASASCSSSSSWISSFVFPLEGGGGS